MTMELIITIAKIALVFGLSVALSFGMTPLVKLFAEKVGAIDVPKDERRMHKTPIPRLGGLAIFISFILCVCLFANLNPQLRGILIGAVLIVVCGVIDDITPLKWYIKFPVQIIAALIVVNHGVLIDHITNPNIFSDTPYINFGAYSAPITVIWIVGITNAVNLIDGLDGLAVGVSSIASLSLMVASIFMIPIVGINITIVCAALAGACIGFMPYNMNPAKIFMGDTGATFLGFMLATITISGFFKFYAVVSFAIPFLVLGIPIFDTLIAFSRRILKGKNPMHADRGHVHHKLIDMGFSQKQSVAILYTMSAILGICAITLASNGELRALFLGLSAVVAVIIGAKVFGRK